MQLSIVGIVDEVFAGVKDLFVGFLLDAEVLGCRAWRGEFDDDIGILPSFIPNGPEPARRVERSVADEKEVGAAEVPIASLLGVEIDEHVAADKIVFSSLEMENDQFNEERHFESMPVAFQ